MRAVAAMLLLMASLAACSDRVPAPVTPTPSPRPGYPPAALTELPEGVLYVQKTTGAPSSLFAMAPGREPVESVTSSGVLAAAGGSQAVVGSLQGGVVLGIGLLTGSQYQKVADGPWANWYPTFLWSSDGKRLAYTVPENEEPGKSRVWTLDTESGKQVLLTPEAGVYALLGWTATGKVLATTPRGLLLLGGGSRELGLPEAGEILDVAMSPDGRSVAVKLGQYEYSEADGVTYIHSRGIWVGELVGGDWRRVLDLNGEPPEVQTIAPVEMQWSADGERLAYHSPIGTGWPYDRFGLDVVNVVTGERTHVVDRPVWTEAWSREGQYFAFVYQNPEAENRLGLLTPDGKIREVDTAVRGMAWAANGRLLLDIPGRLSVLDPETMEVEEVGAEDGKTISVFLEGAIWSPSGRYVAASTPSDAYHRSSLYVIDTEKGTAELFLEEAGFSAVAWVRE